VDPVEFVAEWERRFNAGNATGDLSEARDLRTDDARVVWRAPGMPDVEGAIESAGESIALGATLHFDEVRSEEPNRVRARIVGEGFPTGRVEGQATFLFDGDRLSRLEIDLDESPGGSG